MPVFYDPLVVLLSILVAVQGAFVSLTLARALPQAIGLRRKLLLAGAATVLGVGIWSMHFIGMLALHLPVSVAYDPMRTLSSGLVCILVTGLGFQLVSLGAPSPRKVLLGGAVMGLGIAAMHYVGMSALRAQCVVSYDAPLVGLSVLVGVAAATLALRLAFSPRRVWQTRAASVVLGLAVALMHYTGMAAASFVSGGEVAAIHEPVLDQGALALLVAVVAFVISGIFLLAILPDRSSDFVPSPEPVAVAPVPVPPPEPERLAVQLRGATLLLDPREIRAIQAEGHHTRICDGRGSYPCPQSITAVGGQLDPAVFVRVHRSHIVNRRWVRAFRRDGDQGVVVLEAERPLEVPVSRNNVRRVQDMLVRAA